jgi:hypothetical protein
MKFLWWLKYAVDLAIQSRGVIQADVKPPMARDSGRSPLILIFRVGSAISTILGKRILIREYLGLGTPLWLW